MIKRPLPRPFLYLVIAFLGAVLITGYLAFDAMRDLFASWNSPVPTSFDPVPGAAEDSPVNSLQARPFDRNAPIQPADYPTAEPWNGIDRITILVMGLDFRDWVDNYGATRTDSMILLTIDPESGTAGILSLPRDLWVAIPGFGFGKLNTAYQLGELNNIPGRGPGLIMETIEQLLGININYYAQVDFNTFTRLIDEIGGVKLEIEEAITVDPLGNAPPKTLKPGLQTLSGSVALAFARARKTSGGDFDRAGRQQQILLAIQQRILQFDLIPTLIARSPDIYQEISEGVRTNLSLDQMVKLGLMAGQIDRSSIKQGVINETYATASWSADGQYILLPIPDKIRVLRDEIFVAERTVSSIPANTTREQTLAEENARIAVLNGTATPGLAAETTEWLEEKSLTVIVTGNSDTIYQNTTIIDYSGKPVTLQFLVEQLDISPSRIFHSYDPDSEIDIEINLGVDWANREE